LSRCSKQKFNQEENIPDSGGKLSGCFAALGQLPGALSRKPIPTLNADPVGTWPEQNCFRSTRRETIQLHLVDVTVYSYFQGF